MTTWIASLGARIGARNDLLVIALIVMIVAMLIVPLPTVLVDCLIAANIVLALLIFVSTFYVKTVIEFSSFPAVLLVTTLFRLALSISTTRLILLQGDAGQIITTFGEFVVGDNLVVGIVIFAIVTIVQFIVITKGAERIAEVVARFSLDAMPGKQMSIDGDARAGTIDASQVEVRRRRIEQESQLHGAFDGALKFVKGDAIAGMIIICVNMIGGIATGTLVHGMSLSDAVATYSLLSIGDGLVAQIPALLISVGAGFIVTRVSNDEGNLGQKMVAELASQPTVLAICAALSLAIGLLPGFPFAAFATLAGVLLMAYVYRRHIETPGAGATARQSGSTHEAGGEGAQGGAPRPLVLQVSQELRGDAAIAGLGERLGQAVLNELGIVIPEVSVDFVAMAETDRVQLLIHEMPAATIGLAFGRCLIPEFDRGLPLSDLDCVELVDPDPACASVTGTAWWVAGADSERVRALGYVVVDALDALEARVVRLVARNIHELFGVQETKHLLDSVERTHPELLKETYRHLPLIRITEIMQRLLVECVPVRNTRLVLEAIALWAPREKDALVLAEHVRASLAKTISARFLSDRTKRIILVAPESEERVRASIRQVAAGAFLQMAPEDSQAFIEAVEHRIDGLRLRRVSNAVLLCAVDIRRFVKKLVERRFPDLDVVSFAEVSDSVQIDIAASI
ncbi:Invasion protein InvA [Pararobbsia alpina]|uniref:EscV/YscV/HrcV family type III secretion system export apparatus protein n=1 Tax=Pararobbsia alpina TaxID=621374 RepID=UPI0039A761DA